MAEWSSGKLSLNALSLLSKDTVWSGQQSKEILEHSVIQITIYTPDRKSSSLYSSGGYIYLPEPK